MNAKPSVLVVDDDAPFRQVLSGELRRLGYDTALADSGSAALNSLTSHVPSVVLLDLRLPDMSGLDVLEKIAERGNGCEVIMLTGHGSIDTAVESIRMGAFDYIAKPCPLGELEIRLHRALERQSLKSRASLLERGLTPPDVRGSFIGESAEFRHVLGLLERVAPSDSTVLITGETGTGKEMAAKLVHARSRRSRRPFVVVQCAALQESLLQSELFGHERGAFTGADRTKPGLFEVAHGGTLFLDEIGEISHATQVNLLRVLDSATFRRVGGTQEIRVDVRIVAATNRDLAHMVRQNLFRQDLFYRLSTISVHMPALRERTGDVDVLSTHFLRMLGERFNTRKQLSPDALALLRRHAWPGNVRELLHVIENAMIVAEGSEILPAQLPPSVRGALAAVGSDAPSAGSRTLDEMERQHIEDALSEAGQHRGNAARMLGISERNLYRKLRQYGLLK